ncbi:MAG: FAD-dependent monooxygenase [Hyphomicrobiaceae bacterium]|nr:FAD-dependent monooxygenase [Hyphomicrobiaceae bacterium]
MQVAEHGVIIVGGGPTGLMLAGELALAGVNVAIVERRINQELAGSRAGGLHPRTIEILDQRGIADRFVSQGEKHFVVPFADIVLDARDRPTRHNYTLALWQEKIERTLADWVSELSVPVYRGCEVTGFTQDDHCVDIELTEGKLLRASYLVGCDGGRSIVRKKAGIDFTGWEPSISYLIFEADMSDQPAWGIRHGEQGIYALGPLENGKRVRGVVTEPRLNRGDTPSPEELRSVLVAAYGTDFGISNITWLSRFTDAARQAEKYRNRRLLLAGDAAHIHSPAGGQGLQIGLQDAANLGWKLAQVVKGISSEDLLDTYHAERHPVAAAVLQHTMAITALNRGDDRTSALREMLAEVMQKDEPRKWYTALMSGLDIRYDLGEGHPLLGRRMPDIDLVTADGELRVYSLLHEARPVLLYFEERDGFALDPWAERLRVVDATNRGSWELPVLGTVATPHAVLIRPDGHVAWVGDRSSDGLEDALIKWFGDST